MTSRRPDFFIVGAPRSGTTALFEHLGRHPQIFVPRTKEPIFFGADEAFPFSDRHRVTLDEYLALFADAGDALRVGEGSTTYLYSRTAASEIHDFKPDARIIIMLRDPIAVMHAQHSGWVSAGRQPIGDFATALEVQDRQRAGLEPPNPRASSSHYRDIVDYANHVGTYFDTFGRERVHVILFDDWAADTPTEYRKTLEFLGVDSSFVTELGVVNPNRRVRSPRLHRLIAEPPTAIQGAARTVVPARVRRKLQRLLLALNNRVAPREPLDPAFVATLRTEFAPEIERLSALIGRDLSSWMAAADDSTVAARTRDGVPVTTSRP